jgi:hypothetical protein
MNELQRECFDVIETTLLEECYFMSGRLPTTVASRSLPPPVVGALERRRLAAYRTTSEEYAVHLAAWNRSTKPEPPASPSSDGGYSSSSASEYSYSTRQRARHSSNYCRGTVPPLRANHSGTKRRVSLCRQCGKTASECPGAKHAKGANQRCAFVCKTCGAGPLSCSCKTSLASPARRGPCFPTCKGRHRANAVDLSGILTSSRNAQGGGGGGAPGKPPPAARRPRTCRSCGKTMRECNGAKGGFVGGAQNCQFKCARCGTGPLLCQCAGGKENAAPSVHC